MFQLSQPPGIYVLDTQIKLLIDFIDLIFIDFMQSTTNQYAFEHNIGSIHEPFMNVTIITISAASVIHSSN